MIRRPPRSTRTDTLFPYTTLFRSAVVTDSAIVDAIKRNLKPPMGALSQYKQNGAESDPDAMYRALVLYWTAVRDTFPDAWGKPPSQSRLMHSAGIRAMAALMDPVMLRADSSTTPEQIGRDTVLTP